jgi:hypothetical protein
LSHRFSGTSRRLRKLRIFGRTTLEIQFMCDSRTFPVTVFRSLLTSRQGRVV